MNRGLLTWYLVAAVLAATMTGATANDPDWQISYFVSYTAVIVTGFWAAHRRPPTERLPWRWVATSQLLLLGGDSVYPVAQLLHLPGSSLLAAVLWSGGYLSYGVALVVMGRRRAGRWLRPAVLDTLTLVTAAAMVVWVTFISPFLSEVPSFPVDAYIIVMPPIGDVVILAGVLLIALSPGRRGGATGLLMISAALRVVSDLGLSFIPWPTVGIAAGTFAILLSNALVIGAGLHPGAGELTTAAPGKPTVHPARPWFLGVGLVTALTIMFLRRDYATLERGLLFAASIMTALFVVVRFTSALRSLERVERQLSFQAHHDPLTGLLNRAALTAYLENATPPGSTLLYLDLDGFKAVNDQAGHAAGDAILCTVSERLRAAVREGDAVARLGGDEFAVVLRGQSGEQAAAVANRILRDVALPVDYNGVAYTVGASIGLAGGTFADTDAEWRPAALLRAADAAMYKAKRGGRGRCVAAGAPAVAAVS